MTLPFPGTVPGPVIFGALTDTACLVWQEECGEPSSCWIYDNGVVSRNYFLIAIATKAVSMLFFSLAFILYKPPPEALEEEKRESTRRRSSSKKMAFLNDSIKSGEFEHQILENEPSADNSVVERTTVLWRYNDSCKWISILLKKKFPNSKCIVFNRYLIALLIFFQNGSMFFCVSFIDYGDTSVYVTLHQIYILCWEDKFISIPVFVYISQ